MDLDFTPEETELRARVREWLAEHVPESWNGVFFPDAVPFSFDFCRLLAAQGWLIHHWPVAEGGNGGTIWEQVVMQEELWAAHEPRAGQYMNVNWIGPALQRFGTDAQKAEFLPPITRGDAAWCQLFSEPDAGSDLKALRTAARLDGDTYVVTGEKVWTSYADFARYGFLLARSEPGTRGREGLTVLLIDMDSPGIEVREIPSMLGHHRVHSVVCQDVRVPAHRVLGTAGDGWRVAMTALSYERAGTARYALATRTLGLLERHPRAAEPVFRDRIVRLLAQGRAAELMNYRVVAGKEHGDLKPWHASAARLHSVRYEQAVADLAEDMLGELVRISTDDERSPHHGEVESFAVRHAAAASMTAGAYEIQMSIVAEQALGLPRTR